MKKYFLCFFFIFLQKITNQNQKEKIKNDKYIMQWAKGVQIEKRGAKSRLTQAQPKSTLSSTSSQIQTKNARPSSISAIS